MNRIIDSKKIGYYVGIIKLVSMKNNIKLIFYIYLLIKLQMFQNMV